MALLGLGYAGFGRPTSTDWRQFGTGLVGLQAVERGNSLLAFRMHDRKQRIVIDRAMGDGDALLRLGGRRRRGAGCGSPARLERAGVRVTPAETLADARRVRGTDLVSRSCRQPAGSVSMAPRSTTRRSRRDGRSRVFRTGPLGLGHAVLTVENIEPMMAFYVDVLGFGLSDYIKNRSALISSTSTRGITAWR